VTISPVSTAAVLATPAFSAAVAAPAAAAGDSFTPGVTTASPVYARPGQPVIDIAKFGGKADGLSNSTQAFQSALAKLSKAGGGTLKLNAGTYLIDPDTLQIPSNVTIVGNGATLKASGSGKSLLSINGSRTSISGLKINGGNAVTQGIDIAKGSSNLSLSNLDITGLAQVGSSDSVVGIHIHEQTSHIAIDTVDIHDFAAHVASSAGFRTTRGILIDTPAGAGIAQNVSITRSTFANLGKRNDDGVGISIENGTDQSNLVIDNNTFTNIAAQSVKILVGGATVSNNTITNNFATADASNTIGKIPFDVYAAISLYASNTTIDGNTISTPGSFFNGIEVGGSNQTVNNTITNNSISFGANYDVKTNNFAAVRTMTDAFGMTISYNTFNHATYGMALTSNSSVKFPGNTFTDLYQSLTLYTPPNLPVNPSNPRLATAAAATAASSGTGTTGTG
jgi:hypothetical protein